MANLLGLPFPTLKLYHLTAHVIFSWPVTNPHQPFPKAGHFGHHAKDSWHATRDDKKAVFFDERGDHSANKGKREEQISFVVF